MSNSENNSLNELDNHSVKLGDVILIKMYGNKKVKFEISFKEDSEDLDKILNRAFKDELNKKKILFGGLYGLPKAKIDGSMDS